MLDKNIKYKEVIILLVVGFIGYKVVDNVDVILSALGSFISLLSPFIYALIFAYILNPIMTLFEKKLRLKRGLAILATYLLMTGLIIIGVVFLVPSIIDSIISLIDSMPSYVSEIQEWINKIINNDEINDFITSIGLMDNIVSISTTVGKVALNTLEGSLTSIIDITTNIVKIVIGYLLAIYVLLDKEDFTKAAKTLTYMIFKEKIASVIVKWVRIYNSMIGIYVGTKAIDSAIIGLIALIGLVILKAPYAVLLALIVAITNMIPYFGPLIGELVGAIAGFFVSPSMGIIVLIFLLLVQQFDAWYLDPKLIGNKVGVEPFILIVAVIVAGGYFGAVGMLLASPTAATIKQVVDERMAIFRKNHPELMKKAATDVKK